MNYFANPSNFYSSGPSSQQTPYNRVAKQEYPYEDLSLATPSLEQSWFGANFAMSPYDLASQLLPSSSLQPQQHHFHQQYSYEQPPLAYYHDSSSSSGGSTFSSPQSHPAPSPPRLGANSYFPAFSSPATRSGSDSSSGIDLSVLDGGLGHHQEEKMECGFTGFFSANGGVKQEEEEEEEEEERPETRVGYLVREGSLAASDASDESFVSPPPTPPISSFAPTPIPSSSKRSRSPVVSANITRPRGVSTSTASSTSQPTRKRVKISPFSSLFPSGSSSVPSLPRDFGTYGPGGSSLFDDSPSASGSRNGRATTPDFSGRDDCWGVGKEAYDKLSAKAKKQLRNKIGARRFRERRKEYITTLEGKLAERDELIGDFRERLQATLGQVEEHQARLAELERGQQP